MTIIIIVLARRLYLAGGAPPTLSVVMVLWDVGIYSHCKNMKKKNKARIQKPLAIPDVQFITTTNNQKHPRKRTLDHGNWWWKLVIGLPEETWILITIDERSMISIYWTTESQKRGCVHAADNGTGTHDSNKWPTITHNKDSARHGMRRKAYNRPVFAASHGLLNLIGRPSKYRWHGTLGAQLYKTRKTNIGENERKRVNHERGWRPCAIVGHLYHNKLRATSTDRWDDTHGTVRWAYKQSKCTHTALMTWVFRLLRRRQCTTGAIFFPHWAKGFGIADC